MKNHWTKTLIGLAAILYILHNDWWFWDDPQLVLGLPVGLLYHLLLCLGAVILLFLFVYFERCPRSDSDTT
ncbi:MAG TPA: DUF3311 domain-containing protein [Acidobacteriota bacterium]|nr:DUF3311 domain-containing protein [Acidobacteriota bacterium]